jgi:hypothetical protein
MFPILTILLIIFLVSFQDAHGAALPVYENIPRFSVKEPVIVEAKRV